MLTYEKALEIIEFQKQQIADLTAERDRLKAESTNVSDALSISNEHNAELSEQYNDAVNALENLWKANEAVNAGDRRYYNGKWYRCIQAHTTQADWMPDIVPALWGEE